MNGFQSFSFAFHFSSFQCAGTTEDRVSAFGKVEHLVFSSFVPFSIRACASSVVSSIGSDFSELPCGSPLSLHFLRKRFYCPICGEFEMSIIFRRYYLFCVEPPRDFCRAQNFQLLNVCDQNLSFPNCTRECIFEEYSR